MSDKKQEIILAALKEFAEKSFNDASLNNIIKTSCTSKGTFYYYFKDKADLYTQLIERAVQEKWLFIQQAISTIDWDQSGKDIFEIFSQQAIFGIEFAEKFPDYHALSENFLKEAGNPIYHIVLEKLSLNQEELHDELFLAAYQNGELDTHYSLEFIKKTTLYLFNNFNEIFSYPCSMQEKTEKLHYLVDFLKAGFGKKS